jgi:hypothetical protein
MHSGSQPTHTGAGRPPNSQTAGSAAVPSSCFGRDAGRAGAHGAAALVVAGAHGAARGRRRRPRARRRRHAAVAPACRAAHLRSAARWMRSARRAAAQGKASSACPPCAPTSTSATCRGRRARRGRTRAGGRARAARPRAGGRPRSAARAPPAPRTTSSAAATTRPTPSRPSGCAACCCRCRSPCAPAPRRLHSNLATGTFAVPPLTLCCAGRAAGASESVGEVSGHGSQGACGNMVRVEAFRARSLGGAAARAHGPRGTGQVVGAVDDADAGQPKVGQLQVAVGRNEQVVGLQVAVDDALRPRPPPST